jgi:predicted nucleic acid-binding protein
VTTYLLDANALIALTVAEHEHHDVAVTWAGGVSSVAVCPVVEGALTRFLVRIGESTDAAGSVLEAIHASPRCAFWPDSLSYTEARLAHVHGHRQVTDAYLASLAAAHGGLLATLDEGLAAALPDMVELIRAAAG